MQSADCTPQRGHAEGRWQSSAPPPGLLKGRGQSSALVVHPSQGTDRPYAPVDECLACHLHLPPSPVHTWQTHLRRREGRRRGGGRGGGGEEGRRRRGGGQEERGEEGRRREGKRAGGERGGERGEGGEEGGEEGAERQVEHRKVAQDSIQVSITRVELVHVRYMHS